MKSAIYIICLFTGMLLSMKEAHGQQYDRYWLGENWYFEPKEVLMRFDEDTISYHVIDLPEKIQIGRGSLAMSNVEGELQFFTNGNVVVSWDYHIMQGGKGFNQGATNDDYDVDGHDLYYNTPYNPYTYQVIPDAYDEHTYYLIHAFIIEEGGCQYFDVPKMQISKIDMSANDGKGKVVYKNHYFSQESGGPDFALIRHGNGKDWWVVQHQQLNGLAYKSILLHRDSVVQVVQSTIPGLSSDWFSCFDWFFTNGSPFATSADGSRMVDIYGQAYAKLLAFDRCSGEVSLLDTFSTGISLCQLSSTLDTCGMRTYAFSPSGRYLYGAGYAEFAQWDLEAADIAASKVKIGGPAWVLDDEQNVIEGYYSGLEVFATGPDGKIYNLFRNMHHVIEHPDEPGAACGLCIASDHPPSCLGDNVPYWLFSTPHPNYRLGALAGSDCDTIVSGTNQAVASSLALRVLPNPADSPVQVEITLPNYATPTELRVYDTAGRLVHQHLFPPYAYLHTLDVSDWAAGVYGVVLAQEGEIRAVTRLMVTR